MGQVRYKVPKLHNYTILNKIVMLFLLKHTVFTVFSGTIKNPIVSVWYYHMPFFSNVETQVGSATNGATPSSFYRNAILRASAG